MNKVKVPAGLANEGIDQFGNNIIKLTHFEGNEKITFFIKLDTRKDGQHGAYYRVEALREDMDEKDFDRKVKIEKSFLENEERKKVFRESGKAGPTRPAVQPAVAKPVARPPVTQPVEEVVLPLGDNIF